ncbi:Porphobilinogen deaminase [hydrothermal vent metagenome]|uniref:hydroxymethylbilane synthase n=1 Tax=hydrothermal vent metagenome TaxID=652676 RepID=A0A1W1EKB8_9ZZZZ
MNRLTIATRASDLALWQAYFVRDEILKLYPDMEILLNKITSRGDKILNKPLALIGGKGHFTKELEDEMLAGNADIAVHSLKDVPSYMPEGLELVAISKRGDQRDLFLSHKYKSLKKLPKNAVVGTTSLRRRMQISKIRPDLILKDLRGNVNTRLRKLKEGEYDAIILAYIGLKRLDLIKDIPYTKKLSLKMMIPPMGQASLGIQIVSSNSRVREIVEKLNDKDSFLCSKIERDFISKIGAGCSAPVACNATIDDNVVNLQAMIGYPDGSNIMYKNLTALISNCNDLGTTLANDFISDGALEILEKAQSVAFKDKMPQRI